MRRSVRHVEPSEPSESARWGAKLFCALLQNDLPAASALLAARGDGQWPYALPAYHAAVLGAVEHGGGADAVALLAAAGAPAAAADMPASVGLNDQQLLPLLEQLGFRGSRTLRQLVDAPSAAAVAVASRRLDLLHALQRAGVDPCRRGNGLADLRPQLLRSAVVALRGCDAGELSAAVAAALQTLDVLVATGQTGSPLASAVVSCCCALQQRQQRQHDGDGAGSEQQLGAALDTLLHWLQQQLQRGRFTGLSSAALLGLFNAAAVRGSQQLLNSLAEQLRFRYGDDSETAVWMLPHGMRAPNSILFPQLLQRLLTAAASSSQAGSLCWRRFCAAAAGALSRLATVAAEEGQLAALQVMLGAGAPISIHTVIAAAIRQDLAALRMLLGSGQPLPQPRTDGCTRSELPAILMNQSWTQLHSRYTACPVWHVLARSQVRPAACAWLLHAACLACWLSLTVPRPLRSPHVS